MHPGDCVLQPPEIRHRVLEASSGLEVVEIGCPAEHETLGDLDMALPNARIDRAAAAGESGLQFRGEFLHVFARTERLRSHKPVEVTRGRDRFSADAMDYDHQARTLELRGSVRVTLAPPKAP